MPISADAVSKVVGVETVFKDLREPGTLSLPKRIAILGQGNSAVSPVYSTDKAVVTSALEVGQAYGFGSPLHLAALQLFPDNGDGVGGIPVTVFPLVDDGGGVAATGTITPTGDATVTDSYIVTVNNIASEPFTVTVGDSVATIAAAIEVAINANINMPIIAVDGTTVVNLTSKWKGASANDIVFTVLPVDAGDETLAAVQLASGATNPSISAALLKFGDIWETFVLNCLDIADTATLILYTTFGEGRWDPTVKKPLIVFTGNTRATVGTGAGEALEISAARTTDRINSQLVAPGSSDLPFVVASRQLARIAVIADENPPTDYSRGIASGLTPGADNVQWTYANRETAVKAGSSTTKVVNGEIKISDTVTFYHPLGDTSPAYRFVVDIVKLMEATYNTELVFASEAWDGAPLIPTGQATTNPNAKTPAAAKGEVAAVIDGLASNAIISDPKTAKETITAVINSTNPKRLDVAYTIQLSGNTNVIPITQNFGFFFGN